MSICSYYLLYNMSCQLFASSTFVTKQSARKVSVKFHKSQKNCGREVRRLRTRRRMRKCIIMGAICEISQSPRDRWRTTEILQTFSEQFRNRSSWCDHLWNLHLRPFYEQVYTFYSKLNKNIRFLTSQTNMNQY